jgi:hypothetical protein
MKNHSVKEIVKGNDAILTHICEGKAYYEIIVMNTSFKTDKSGMIIGVDEKPFSVYQLEIDTMEDEWKAIYLYPKFKAITLMRWIRKGFLNGKFIRIQ